jgi:3-hydroxybutyryl-CoA dehydrogenase
MLENGKKLVREHLASMQEFNLIDGKEAEEVISKITFTTNMRQAVEQADFIFEAIFEDLKIKQELFKTISPWTKPGVVLASNTSSFDISELAEVTVNPERVIGAHWFHPPQITPCIELIVAEKTSPETLKKAQEMALTLGKYGTRCTNFPGFVANRIQFAMAAEAFRIVQEGLSTPEEVDRIVKSSFGFRLGAYGPFEIADQAGIDVYISIFEYLLEHLKNPQYTPPQILKDLAAKGHLGLKSGKGFYDYSGMGAEAFRKSRNKKFYDRLVIFNKENM